MTTNTNAALREFAEGRIHHLNRGQCPDIVAGHDSRDPDCPVCAALTTAAAVPAASRHSEYPPLPEPDATTVGLGAVWNRHSMRAYVDAARALLAQAAPQQEAQERCPSCRNGDIYACTFPFPTSRNTAPQAAPADVEVPSGWRFNVSRRDGRIWLTISTPNGASASLSAAENTENEDDTIVAQVLDFLADSLAAPTTHAAPAAQGDADDAARYRFLRSCNLAKHPAVRDGFELGDAHLDAAIDAALKKGVNHD